MCPTLSIVLQEMKYEQILRNLYILGVSDLSKCVTI